MPQATDEQRALMEKWFGDSVDMRGPYAFLMSRGYRDDRGMIVPPVPSHKVSREEGECIDFLCDEWDFGWMSTIFHQMIADTEHGSRRDQSSSAEK